MTALRFLATACIENYKFEICFDHENVEAGNPENTIWRMIMRRWRFLYALLALTVASGPVWAYSGSYDVGGGNNDFASPQAAVAALVVGGMTGPVTLNVYSGTYTGIVTIPNISGASETYRLTIQNAPGNNPVITNPSGTSDNTACGIFVNSADYVTIRGMEVRGCNRGGIYVAGSSSDSCKKIYLENNYVHDNCVALSRHVVYVVYCQDGQVTSNQIDGTLNATYPSLELESCNRTLVVNNVVTSPDKGFFTYAVHEQGSVASEYYYNTFVCYNSQAAWMTNGNFSNHVFKNNIFYNGGDSTSGYTQCAWGQWGSSTATLTSDYNIFYCSGADTIDVYPGGNAHSLEWWRLQGQDAHSYSFDPGLVSGVFPFNAHLLNRPSVADSDATPLLAITTVDIDGNPRDATYPDIGAREVTLPAGDIILGYRPLFPRRGIAGITVFTFAMDYVSRSNTPPSSPTALLSGNPLGALTEPYPTPPSGYVFGARLQLKTAVATAGVYTHSYTSNSLSLPASGSFAGPVVVSEMSGTYNVGGGLPMDYSTITAAVADLIYRGMSGDVVLNIYNGTYTHTNSNNLRISSAATNLTYYISGLGTYNLTFQAAPGQTPMVQTTGSVRAFYLNGASNVTISGLKIVCATNQPIYIDASTTTYPTNNTIRNNVLTWTGASNSGAIYASGSLGLLIENNTIYVTGTGAVGGGIVLASTRGNAVVRNNTVYAPRTTQFCAYHQGAASPSNATTEWYNNTFYAKATNSACFQYTNLYPQVILKDNIFCQAGTGSSYTTALRTSTTTWACPVTSNYNLFWSSGAYASSSTGGTSYTFVQYKTACSLKDQNSLNCNPDFVYNGAVLDSTLHINRTSCANGAAIPITGVTVDRDGDVRNAFGPDIGADEVGPATEPVDIGDHFCLYIEPGRETAIHWCFPHYGSPHFSWLPGCQYATPGCDEVCPPYSGTGPVTWTVTLDSSTVDCPLPGGWWTARFSGPGEGCVCVFFEYQLSVELMSFAATGGDGVVRLTWTTASETNNDHFQVYRGNDHAGWDMIGQVNGHGTVANTQRYEFRDENVVNGQTYRYRLATANVEGAMEWLESVVEATPQATEVLPTEYALYQNYPNPFNPVTEIRFDLVENGTVTLKVYNPIGQEVATIVNQSMAAGRHSITFDASHLPSGMYLYRLETAGFSATKKMLLMK
jgi:hypothetical protein